MSAINLPRHLWLTLPLMVLCYLMRHRAVEPLGSVNVAKASQGLGRLPIRPAPAVRHFGRTGSPSRPRSCRNMQPQGSRRPQDSAALKSSALRAHSFGVELSTNAEIAVTLIRRERPSFRAGFHLSGLERRGATDRYPAAASLHQRSKQLGPKTSSREFALSDCRHPGWPC
jgi:hypothetical protein